MHPNFKGEGEAEAAVMNAENGEIIKDFDDIFKFIGGWGPFQVLVLHVYQVLILIIAST